MDGLLACGAMERVKDVFNVRQGCRTGNNSLFKIKKQELLAMGEEEQSFFRPSVDSGSLQTMFFKRSHTYSFHMVKMDLTFLARNNSRIKFLRIIGNSRFKGILGLSC